MHSCIVINFTLRCGKRAKGVCAMMKLQIDNNLFKKSLTQLEVYVRERDYSGYDPYDALNSNIFGKYNNKWIRIAVTQLFVRSPLNLRAFFKTPKGKNPKSIGIFLQAYCKVYEMSLLDKSNLINLLEKLANWLIKKSSHEYSGYCWGYNFDWQSANHYLKKGEPTVVNTSFISNAFLDLYDKTENEEYLKIARSSCDFILKELNIIERPEGACFSYTPFDKNLCHNANLLGAELLSRVYSITDEETLLEYAKKAFDFTLYHQNPDGSWDYSIDPQTGKGRKQIDFHQGFVLDSIFSFIKYTQPPDDKYMKSLLKGAEFYKKEQFFPDGRCKYRWPRVYPINIHNQAQGIITFSKLRDIAPEYLEFAKKIALWTIKNMQDENGYFYYQKHRFYINKIPYMRWGQAWMMLALSTLLEAIKERE